MVFLPFYEENRDENRENRGKIENKENRDSDHFIETLRIANCEFNT